MDESILDSIKLILGVDTEYDAFDSEILMAINSSFMSLTQLGLGPAEGFKVPNKATTWADILGTRQDLESVRSYIGIKSRILFDPPANSYILQALQDSATEFQWRIRAQLEETTQLEEATNV